MLNIFKEKFLQSHFYNKFLNKFFEVVIDLIAPKCCYLCGIRLFNNENLCDNCKQKAVLIDQSNCCKKCGYPILTYDQTGNFLDKKVKKICPSCNTEKRYFDRAYSVYQYKNIIRKTLMNLKFYFDIDAISFIGIQMFKTYKKTIDKVDFICIIPITNFKLFNKGYNHAGLIAKSFYEVLKKQNQQDNTKETILYDLFVKTTKSVASKQLSQHERWLKKYNFKINSKYKTKEYIDSFTGKKFLIIDDIMTTGATLNVASKIIKDTFPKSKVYCLTFARTMLY